MRDRHNRLLLGLFVWSCIIIGLIVLYIHGDLF